MANVLKSGKEGEDKAASEYSKGLSGGFGPTESGMSKLMEKQQKGQLAMAGNIAKKIASRPGIVSAKGVQAPIDMQLVAQQQGLFTEVSEGAAGLQRKSADLRQIMAAQEKEKLRTEVLLAAKRRADARQATLDNVAAAAELAVKAANPV